MVGIGLLLIWLLRMIEILILVRCILSWIPGLNNRFTAFMYAITDPFLQPVQSLLSKWFGGRGMYIDFSPILVYFLLEFLKVLIGRILF